MFAFIPFLVLFVVTPYLLVSVQPWIEWIPINHLKVTSATKQLFKMCHLIHKLRIFLFHRKVKFCSWDIQVFVFLTIPWFIKSVTSWVWVHKTVHFIIYLLNHNSLSHQTRAIFFWNLFEQFWKLGLSFRPFSI